MNINEYPKSINGRQCIGPCYNSNTTIIHPTTFEYTTPAIDKPFCPVKDYYDENKELQNIDICLNETKNTKNDKNDIYIDISLPIFDFSCNYFLKTYYDIRSFHDCIKYINNNNHLPYLTKKRVINCAAKTHFDEIDLTYDLTKMLLNISIKNWCDDIYNDTNNFIEVNKNQIKLGKKNTTHLTELKNIKINFLKKKFINEQIMYKFLKYYLQDKDKNKEKYENYFMDNLKENLIKYIIKKIKNTIN